MNAATKQSLLDLVDQAVASGWTVTSALDYLALSPARYYRWLARAGRLDDLAPGGNPVHALLEDEVAAIVAVFEQWAEVDRSHRKLAHRGSYIGKFWASPATVRRVLNNADLRFRALPRPGKSRKAPFPQWLTYRPRQVWIYDTTHFMAAEMAVLIIMDLVSRKWLSTVVSSQETSIQVQVGFNRALQAEGIDDVLAARAAQAAAGWQGPHLPVLLAMSDNGPQMRSGDTAEYMALSSILQHFGRPGTPQDQGWIESLNGHLKREYPHLTKIRDPATLRAELDVVREHYNTIRLHEGIGYVTPDDEHNGRGPAIRKARRDGMENAHQRRLAAHRATRTTTLENDPTDDA